ncbi:MAG: hypothetical protein IJK06_07010 [Clostridia bacterium]|nr:hypothetical protein [Clostridia bacterium]
MNIVNKLKNAVTGGEWYVAYKKKEQENWQLTDVPENQWCADPFALEVGNEHYIFVEQYRKECEKGCIGYFRFVDDKPVNQGIIIENSYHMSYPDVFLYQGRYYMIPESAANGTVDLYLADDFPNKWHKEKTLINGHKYVDSTVYQDGEDYYLITYSMTGGYEIHVFSLNMEKQEVKLLSKKRYNQNVGRPGGRLYLEEGKLMRPAQDCSIKYGEALIIYQVDNFNQNGAYVEHEVQRIEATYIGVAMNPERAHHLTFDGTWQTIDVYKERFYPLHFLKILIRSHRK